MKLFKSVRLVLAFSLLLNLVPANAFASRYATCWTESPQHYTAWRKAGRGLSNMTLGWLEILYQPFYLAQEGNRLPIAFFGGIMKGLSLTIVRFAAGAYEFVTFPVPLPEGYKPLIYPEFSPPDYCAEKTIANKPEPSPA